MSGSIIAVVTLVALIAPRLTLAQATAPSQSAPAQPDTDSDPTRPVFISLRPEFYALGDGVEQRALITRYDAAILPSLRFPHGGRGIIMRLELPITAADVGLSQSSGIGDAYAQMFLVPYATRRFAWAVGSGFILPTATDELIGAGKWVVAPVTAPIWRFARGLFLVKFQNLSSIGGDGARPDINHLLITPTFIHAIVPGWWVLLDTETKSKWNEDGRTGVKSGFQLGRVISPGVGFWVKPEAWWGPNRDGKWNLKFGLVWYQRRTT
jgi:hypothetical protein